MSQTNNEGVCFTMADGVSVNRVDDISNEVKAVCNFVDVFINRGYYGVDGISNSAIMFINGFYGIGNGADIFIKEAR